MHRNNNNEYDHVTVPSIVLQKTLSNDDSRVVQHLSFLPRFGVFWFTGGVTWFNHITKVTVFIPNFFFGGGGSVKVVING